MYYKIQAFNEQTELYMYYQIKAFNEQTELRSVNEEVAYICNTKQTCESSKILQLLMTSRDFQDILI